MSQKEWKRISVSTTPNKPIDQIRALAQAINEMDPDILMLCEVGGLESLENFNRHFLGNRFASHLIEGNSDRGIDLGYLVRRSLPFKYDLISHKHRTIDFLYPHEKLSRETGYDHLQSARITSHRFSRDVLELRVFEEGIEQPVLVLLLVHLKSQLDRDRIDPRGRDRRKAELEKLVKIHAEINQEFSGQVPIVLAGDFNGVAGLPLSDPEFEALYRETDLRDVLEIAAVDSRERFTHLQFQMRREGLSKQLDYIFLPKSLASRVDHERSGVYRFKDEMGMTMLIPRTLNEKKLLPSDHYPVVLSLKPDIR